MSHLNETGQNYFVHLFRAWKISFILLVHGVFPNIWKTRASDLLCKERLGDDSTRAYLLKTMWNIDERPLSEIEERASIWDRASDREIATKVHLGILRKEEKSINKKQKKKKK